MIKICEKFKKQETEAMKYVQCSRLWIIINKRQYE